MLKNILASRPGFDDWLFSAKTFVAGMLALFIALAFDLDRPVWAMATVYIIANPLTGVLASKAVYRVVGTMIGAVFAVALVPNLVDAPVLLSLAMAGWVGLCLYLSRLDRTPRSYLFMLAGYTAAIIGFPCVTDPGIVFDVAVARVQEISLGIICATVVSHVVFPRHLGPVLAARIDRALHDVRALAALSFAGNHDEEKLHGDRIKLIADIGEIHGLAVHVGYERSLLNGMTRPLQALQNAMAALLPSLYSLHDRITALAATGPGVPENVAVLLQNIEGWIQDGDADPFDRTRINQLHSDISELAHQYEVNRNWHDLLVINLCVRLHRMIGFYDDCQLLWAGIREGRVPHSVVDRWRDRGDKPALHVDYGLAVRSGLTASIATLVVCLIWVETGWPNGASAAMMAAVGTSILSFLDDPVPAQKGFITYTLFSVAVTLFYGYAVLPAIDGFPLLVVVFAPYLLLIGLLIPSPKTFIFALPMIVNTVMLLNISTRYSGNFASSLDGAVAMISGFVVAVVVTAMMRSMTPDHSIRRLLQANWRDLANLARFDHVAPRMTVLRRLLDRQGLILPKLAQAPDHRTRLMRAMPEVSIAANLVDLRRVRKGLDGQIGDRMDRFLAVMATHFDLRTRDFDRPPDGELLTLLDEILMLATARSTLADMHDISGGADRLIGLVASRDMQIGAKSTEMDPVFKRRLVVSLVAMRRVLARDGEPDFSPRFEQIASCLLCANDLAPAGLAGRA
ncbi:FUSC family protein [uncultured Thalassospira sp.]|uniref:FUSC family protein n=1 Tax=uncultured Thalassospira sp. TaxID=404382 RepID=UPI0030DB65AC|tara:strand:- start:6804 stop:9023 length:2220 start_codon:yes stop_codon:yes gene_type:complete